MRVLCRIGFHKLGSVGFQQTRFQGYFARYEPEALVEWLVCQCGFWTPVRFGEWRSLDGKVIRPGRIWMKEASDAKPA